MTFEATTPTEQEQQKTNTDCTAQEKSKQQQENQTTPNHEMNKSSYFNSSSSSASQKMLHNQQQQQLQHYHHNEHCNDDRKQTNLPGYSKAAGNMLVDIIQFIVIALTVPNQVMFAKKDRPSYSYLVCRIIRLWIFTCALILPLILCFYLLDFDLFTTRLPFAGIATTSSLQTPHDLIQANPEILGICHPYWHGIRAATYSQNIPILELPGIVSSRHQRRLLKFLKRLTNLKLIIVNGIPPKTIDFAYAIKQKLPGVRVQFIYHGSFSQQFHVDEAYVLNELIIAAKENVIAKVGLVKNGMTATFQSFGVDAIELWNFASPVSNSLAAVVASPERDRFKLRNRPWRIGIFGSCEVHKNIITQIAAACQFELAEVYVKWKPAVPYFDHCKATLIETGELSHDKFLHVLSTMDITLYVSLTEAFPMTVVESISFSIPSIVSPTSNIYELDKSIKEQLTVNELDSPDCIAERIRYVMNNYAQLSQAVSTLVPRINERALSLWNSFIRMDD